MNEFISWSVVALAAIIAIGGYAAYSTSQGGGFHAAIDIDDKIVEIGCKV